MSGQGARDDETTVADVFMATAAALGLSPSRRREGLDVLAAAEHRAEARDDERGALAKEIRSKAASMASRSTTAFPSVPRVNGAGSVSERRSSREP